MLIYWINNLLESSWQVSMVNYSYWNTNKAFVFKIKPHKFSTQKPLTKLTLEKSITSICSTSPLYVHKSPIFQKLSPLTDKCLMININFKFRNRIIYSMSQLNLFQLNPYQKLNNDADTVKISKIYENFHSNFLKTRSSNPANGKSKIIPTDMKSPRKWILKIYLTIIFYCFASFMTFKLQLFHCWNLFCSRYFIQIVKY